MNRSIDLQRESIARKKGLTFETSLELGHLRSLLMLLYIVTFAGEQETLLLQWWFTIYNAGPAST